ncbi:MAG TPA: hypothetical protein VLX85_16935 [Stellaceae bacterium]|nr:hypothetical protein [Stellaceae bacterium]
MIRIILTCSTLVIGLASVAYADGNAQSPGYFTQAGAPLVAPVNQNDTSDATIQKQRESGYFPSADAPLAAPDNGNAGAAATASDQAESGYFPSADAPLVSPTNGHR